MPSWGIHRYKNHLLIDIEVVLRGMDVWVALEIAKRLNEGNDGWCYSAFNEDLWK